MRSTVMGALRVTLFWIFAEVVKVIPVIVTCRLRRDGWAGRVSATIMTLIEPVPPPPPGFFRPLHAEKESAVSKRIKKRVLLRFIWHPTPG